MNRQIHEELKSTFIDTVETLRLAVDMNDVYTRLHSARVSYYAQIIGETFRLPEHEIEILKCGGLFHDIGKIGIPNEILLKKTSLTDDEFLEIKKHPLKGADILSALSVFDDIIPLVKYHHERVDGKGYPEGLKGENEIPFLARVISVADAFDAMMSDRQYRKKLGYQETRNGLVNGAGTQFDHMIVVRFLSFFESDKNIYDVESEGL